MDICDKDTIYLMTNNQSLEVHNTLISQPASQLVPHSKLNPPGPVFSLSQSTQYFTNPANRTPLPHEFIDQDALFDSIN